MRFSNVFRFLCGLFIFLIAFLALWGWRSGPFILTSWLTDTRSMAEATAVCFCLLSIPLFYPVQKTTFQKWLFRTFSILVIVVSAFNGRMSLLTGTGLILGGLGFLVYGCPSPSLRAWAPSFQNTLVGLLGLAVMGIGFFNASQHSSRLFFMPLYRIDIAYLSFPISLSFIFLGLGINFLNHEMPLALLLFQRTLRSSLIRIYLFVSLAIIFLGGLLSLASLYRLILEKAPSDMLPLGSVIFENQIRFTMFSIFACVFFVVLIGLFLSKQFRKSFDSLKEIAQRTATGQLGDIEGFIKEGEWIEIVDLKKSLIQVGQGLIGARRNSEEKIKILEKTSKELKDSQQITMSLLEDVDQANKQLSKAKEELQQLNLTLETKVEERTRELKTAQEKLIRGEKLAAMGQLAGAVAHEIRTPLTGLTNSAYFLKLCEEEIKNEEVKKHLVLINKQVSHIDQIVSNLLEFARVKEPEKKETDIAKLIQEVIEKLPPPPSIHLSVQVPKGGATVMLDPFQIKQVFGNLITNAYQACPKGGELKIQTEESQDTDFTIVFEDTGGGITPENLAKIFEPLFSTKPKGTGLGLAICKQLLEKHGGSIQVESAIGKGSKFIVKLPV